VVNPLLDQVGSVGGFVKITNETTEKRIAEPQLLQRSAEIEAVNKELESFSYSGSHNPRDPCVASMASVDPLDAKARNYLGWIRAGMQHMAMLIDDLPNLARVTRVEMHRETIDLTKMASDIARDLQRAEPNRQIALKIDGGLTANGDHRLARVAPQNPLCNAWKFTANRAYSRIAFSALGFPGRRVYLVRDRGAGFDQASTARLFSAFQRLPSMEEFPETGSGKARVNRIIHRHGERVWAGGAVNHGATVYFTVESEQHNTGGKEWNKA